MGRLIGVNEKDLIVGIGLATFTQFRNLFLVRQSKVCTKGVCSSLHCEIALLPQSPFAGPLSHVLYYWISQKSPFILINAVNVVARSDMI